MAGTYYRVLEDIRRDDATVNHQSTRRKWDRGERVSTHETCPKAWIDKWNADSNTADAFTEDDLKCSDGLCTQAALEAFLEAAKTHGVAGNEPWPDDVLIAVGQIEGVFAYETPEKAWNYVLGNGGAISAEILAMNWIVVFTGEDLGYKIPEDENGGVQVRVLDAGVIRLAEQFAVDHGFKIPFEDDESEFDLEIPGGEYDPNNP
jgi:hypothetical protein